MGYITMRWGIAGATIMVCISRQATIFKAKGEDEGLQTYKKFTTVGGAFVRLRCISSVDFEICLKHEKREGCRDTEPQKHITVKHERGFLYSFSNYLYRILVERIQKSTKPVTKNYILLYTNRLYIYIEKNMQAH